MAVVGSHLRLVIPKQTPPVISAVILEYVCLIAWLSCWQLFSRWAFLPTKLSRDLWQISKRSTGWVATPKIRSFSFSLLQAGKHQFCQLFESRIMGICLTILTLCILTYQVLFYWPVWSECPISMCEVSSQDQEFEEQGIPMLGGNAVSELFCKWSSVKFTNNFSWLYPHTLKLRDMVRISTDW